MRLPLLKGAVDSGGSGGEARSARFELPVQTRAAAAAAAPEMQPLLDALGSLPGASDPLAALCAVAEALSRRHAAQCAPGGGRARERACL